MSNHTAPTGAPTEEQTANSAENSRMRPTGAAPISTGQSAFILPRGVRITVLVSSVCLLITGSVLLILGAIGTTNGALQGLTGINAATTGVTLTITGSIGCFVFFMTRADKVGRWKLILLVVACHASGAFAIQCTIIAGQMTSRTPPCENVPVTTSDELVTGSGTVPPLFTCVSDATPQVLSLVILLLSILGFLLGIVCSASCYYAVPRLLCCLCDAPPYHHPAKASQEPATPAEVQPVLAGQAEPEQNQPTAADIVDV
ncbi:uncharacterized protein LOC119734982 [Patiria miniata]|uniref:Uncharacterized protein n=1 Tax=Patiria miniata TaxID=46514 RepID=A0A914ALF2_PATMI|nr:uncharacterized protein LOC119734982 [Patiria miniata]